ncbi:transcriptional regulator [Candidatus Scalindua japonica]|uniref:Transcriptional regulator n=1 Tax=Candidatus Scalindua japonica TaxID=1284222 RepID=A0A286U233_9BACT|nr:transcriptional regulator [Candidatus Scalindua japonica]
MISTSIFANSPCTIYFYNPETNINNFASLKVEFDKYLSSYGSFQFQPFSDSKSFEKFIAGRDDGVFLMSSWHFCQLKRKFPIDIQARLVGISKGKSTHEKILTSNNNIINIDLLKGKTVASSSNEDYTKNILIQMLGEEKRDIIDSIEILTVPKDIDALMAVGYGMADSALTTESSLAKLAAINPKQCDFLRTLARSKEILLPIVAVPEQSDENIELLLTIIEKMEAVLDGKKKLRMLGMDGWKRLGKLERKYLGE